MKIIVDIRRNIPYSTPAMKQIKSTPAAISLLSFHEFLEAYHYNLEISGKELLVSNLEENFTVGFDPLVIDEKPIEINAFILRVAKGDESVIDDWNMHVDRFHPVGEEPENPENGWRDEGKYRGFIINQENGRFVFYHPDKEDGTNGWSGWSHSEDDAKEQIDGMIEDDEGRQWMHNKLLDYDLSKNCF